MPAFDEDLCLVDGSATWSYANIVSSGYGTPTSTTRNAGGFVVLDLKETGAKGLAAVLILPAANASGDELTFTVEACDSSAFGSAVHVLAAFDIAAATSGVILGSEAPCTVIRRFDSKWRYIRAHAVNTASDDQGLGYCYLHYHAFGVL